MSEQIEHPESDLDAEARALFGNWSATRKALKDSRAENARLAGDLGVLTARLEEANRANQQLHESLTQSLAREGVAIAHAGRMEGMAEAARQSLAQRLTPTATDGWLHDLLKRADEPPRANGAGSTHQRDDDPAPHQQGRTEDHQRDQG